MNRDPDYLVSVIGGRGVGKSTVTIRFIHNVSLEDYDGVIDDTYLKTFRISDDDDDDECQNMVVSRQVTLEVLDEMRYEPLCGYHACYFRKSHGFLLLFSLTDRESLLNWADLCWRRVIRARDGLDNDNLSVVLVGTKSDLVDDRVISVEEAMDFAREFKFDKYVEISAKTSCDDVEECFHLLTRLMMRKPWPPRQNEKHTEKRCQIQ